MLDADDTLQHSDPCGLGAASGTWPQLLVVDLGSDRFPDDHTVPAFWSACAERGAPGTRLALRIPPAANLGDDARNVARAAAAMRRLHDFDYVESGTVIVRLPAEKKRGSRRGSFPFPRDGVIASTVETVHILRRKGEAPLPPHDVRIGGRLSNAEWETFFSGYWDLSMFPAPEAEAEIVRRLARMYAFPGERVLAAFAADQDAFQSAVVSVGRLGGAQEIEPSAMGEAVPNRRGGLKTRRVTAVTDDLSLELDDGRTVGLLGVERVPERLAEARRFLEKKTAGTRVYLDDLRSGADGLRAYVHLKSRLHLNAHLIKLGLAVAGRSERHRMLGRFLAYEPPAAAGGSLPAPSGDELEPASPGVGG